MKVLLLFFLATTIATSQAIPPQIHLLRRHSGSGGHQVTGLNCLSWRLAVEVDNIRNWEVVPKECENYIGHYMLGHQYRQDCNLAVSEAYVYTKSLKLAGDGKALRRVQQLLYTNQREEQKQDMESTWPRKNKRNAFVEALLEFMSNKTS